MLIINLFGSWSTRAVLLVVSAFAVFLLLLLVLGLCRCYRWCCCSRRNQDNGNEEEEEDEVLADETTSSSRNGWCSCFKRLRRRSRVREFDTLEDLLLEVEENESGRIHVLGNTAAEQGENEDEDGAGCFEASLETFFPSILHPKKKTKSSRRRGTLDVLEDEEGTFEQQEENQAVEDTDQEQGMEEPLLEESINGE